MTRALTVALAWLALPASALAQEGAGGRAALEAFSTDLQAYSARFFQAVIGTDGELLEEGEGEVMLATPDRFRWRYEGDFPELIVADGERVWQFDEALNQVTVRAQSSMAGDNPLQLLTDISALDESFQLVELGTINDLAYLELTALDVDAQFERMVLAFGNGALERLILEDAFGILAGQTEPLRPLCPDGRQNRVEAHRTQFVQGQVAMLIDGHVAVVSNLRRTEDFCELLAQPGFDLDLVVVNSVLGQTAGLDVAI